MEKTIEYDCECEACKGTGICQGAGVLDSVGVVCHTCKGAGWRNVIVKYVETDKKRKTRPDIERVLAANPGISTGDSIIDKIGGMPYKDWSNGKPFPQGSEMREYTCPDWWYQIANHKLMPGWDECDDSLGQPFSRCPHFANKEQCWKRFDE